MTGPVFTSTNMRIAKQMYEHGASNQTIAEIIGTTSGSVRSTLHRAGITRDHDGRLDIAIGEKLKQRLTAEAASRNQTLTKFMHDLLRKIAEHDLFGPIIEKKQDRKMRRR